ncbi:hypothetical protein P7K49_030286, partial [Saguinus oedipus]
EQGARSTPEQVLHPTPNSYMKLSCSHRQGSPTLQLLLISFSLAFLFPHKGLHFESLHTEAEELSQL